MAVENFTYGSEADIPICCRDQYREGLGQPVVFLGEGLEKRETEQNFCNSYYPFGLRHDNSWERTGRENRNKFNAGSEQNEQTGNYEMYFRAYDPAIGRMTGIDPYAELFRGLNPYNYAANNPIMMNDPSGGILKTPTLEDRTVDNGFNSGYGGDGGGGGGWGFWNSRDALYESIDAHVPFASSGTSESEEEDSDAKAIAIATFINNALEKTVGGASWNLSTGEINIFGSDYEVAYAGLSYMQEHGTLTSSSVWQTHIVGKGRAKFYANRSAQALAVGRKLMPKWSTGLTFVGGRGTVLEAPKNTYNETPWITIAQSQLGVAEIKGDKANPTILNYFKATSYHSKDDSGATGSWCSAFANWSVEQVGISGTNSPAAKSWIGWGDKLTSYKYGAVVIVNQIGTSSYHVGFAVGQTDTYTTILGGNQGSIGAVTESNFYNSSYNFYYYYPSN